MCGISAVLLGDSDATTVFDDLRNSLSSLQHRGQDAAGMSVCQGERIMSRKGLGMAVEVFPTANSEMREAMPGSMGVSHLRYRTAGTSSASEAQPFYVNYPFGISMGVNGNLVNGPELARFLYREAQRHVNTNSDSELLTNVFAHTLGELGNHQTSVDDVFTALREVYRRCKGAFACVVMIVGLGIVGFRDENGIRPLCLGSRPSKTLRGAMDYSLASESTALNKNGFTSIVDILPGQAVVLEKGGGLTFKEIVERKTYTPDVLECIYLAKPDSCIDGISVYESRKNMGRKLANRMRQVLGEAGIEEIDVVVPIPETSNIAAAELAMRLGRKPCVGALLKNQGVARTFIISGQKAREESVRQKFTPIASEFKEKVVCIVDDSLVRGTSSLWIVRLAKECGAKRIILVSCSPEITHPHIHGIDLPNPAELLAHGRTVEEMASYIGCDVLVFQTLEDTIAALVEAGDGTVQGFEAGVFSGEYTSDPRDYLEHLNRACGKSVVAGEDSLQPGSY